MMQLIDTLESYYQELPPFVQQHSERVGRYVQQMVQRILLLQESGLFSQENLLDFDDAYLLGRYHDIGKWGICDELWLSAEPLDEEEFKLICSHTVIGAHLVRKKLWRPGEPINETDIRDLIAAGCLYHHEHWNGSGYPLGRKGKKIPFYVRILTIADAYDAMTADRPYHTGISSDLAFEEIRKEAGRQFDPQLAEVFCSTGIIGVDMEKAL